MFMRTASAAWKSGGAIFVLAFVFLQVMAAGQVEHDKRVEQLFSADPAVRGGAKAELLQHPDPAHLPALLKALPASTGTIRDDLLEILGKYDDPRKIPVFLAVLKSSKTSMGQMERQLAALGAPAAEALLANCPANDEYYGHWAGYVLSWMGKTGTPFLVGAVQSEDGCKHQAGEVGLEAQFGDASELPWDIELASDAAVDQDPRIRGAARKWFDSWKGKEENIDFSEIVDALIAAYQASAPETMVEIAKMLSQSERPRVTRFMRAAVHAPNPEIQQIANRYLSTYPSKTKSGSSGEPRTPRQKIAHLQQLKNALDVDVNLQIVLFLTDPDANVRAAAAERLGEVNAPSMSGREEGSADPATALPGLRHALKDPSPKVRSAALNALGEMRSEQDVGLVVAALKDPDASVVLSAAKALEQIPNDSATPALTEIYRNERNSADLRNQAVWSLEAICNPDSIPAFLDDLLSGGKRPSIKAAWALQCALKKRPDPSAFAPIKRAVEQAEPPWPVEVLVVTLAETKNPQAFEMLVLLLGSKLPNVERSAEEGLGLLGDRRAIPILCGLLKDPTPEVRGSAESALRHYSDFPAPPELIAWLGKDSLAAEVLVLSNDPKAIDALIAAMPSPGVINALVKARDPRVVPALITVLENAKNDSGYRAGAAAALGSLGDSRAVDPLIASLNDDNVSITMQASRALGQLKDKRAIEPLKQAYARWSTGQRENADSAKGFIVQALLDLGDTDLIKRTTGMPVH